MTSPLESQRGDRDLSWAWVSVQRERNDTQSYEWLLSQVGLGALVARRRRIWHGKAGSSGIVAKFRDFWVPQLKRRPREGVRATTLSEQPSKEISPPTPAKATCAMMICLRLAGLAISGRAQRA